jgi:hypothetical protein
MITQIVMGVVCGKTFQTYLVSPMTKTHFLWLPKRRASDGFCPPE